MKLMTFPFILFLFSAPLYAENLGITVGSKNELILLGSRCEILLKQENALCEWKKIIDPHYIAPAEYSKKCLPGKKGLKKLVISDCVPEFAKTYQNKKMLHEGPNCWGTAMSFKKLSTKPRFMWPEEMMYWMNDSPLCRKLTSKEKALPGDIINVYAPEKLSANERLEKDAGTKFWAALYPKRYTLPSVDPGGSEYTGFHRLLHSVTYVSNELAFGKDSPAKDDRFYFHPLEEVYGRPSGDHEVECQENQTLDPYIREYQKTPKNIKGSKCSYFSQISRCENFADYFSKAPLDATNTETWIRVQSLQGLQEKLFPLLTSSNKVLEGCEITLIIALADLTVTRVANQLQKTGLDKLSEMLLTQEYFAAAGIRQTLEQFEYVKPLR
jgi:hypothetical protein